MFSVRLYTLGVTIVGGDFKYNMLTSKLLFAKSDAVNVADHPRYARVSSVNSMYLFTLYLV